MILRGTAIARQPVVERADVGWARRQVVELAKRHGFGDTTASRIEITVQEAARNIIKHAGKGLIVAQTVASQDTHYLDVLAIDSGQGMVDISKCMQDGYSSAGSMGTGLGALKRLSDEFEVFSQPRQGAVFLMRFWGEHSRLEQKVRERMCNFAGLLVPHPNEQVSGDAWSLHCTPDFELALLADGLGHGPDAAKAVLCAQECFHGIVERDARMELPEMIERMHADLRRTRGAAVALARISREQHQVEFCSLGNVQGMIGEKTRNRYLLTSNGIVGVEKSRAHSQVYPLHPTEAFVMATDGVQSRWQLPPGLNVWRMAPMLAASILFNQFGRGRDDVGILVFPPVA